MTRPLLALPAGALCLAAGLQATAQRPPHIILLMADQQRADAMGCAGNAAVLTPHLDALAADGYRFNHAYSTCPSSTPARATLLTGLAPWHHGMLGYGVVAEHYRYEMPRMLRRKGYYTLGIGKMHWHPQRALHGFHATLLDESGRIEDPYFMSDYRRWFLTQAPAANPDATGLGWNAHGARPYALPERLHPTVWTADRAVEVIQNYDGQAPLFLKVSFARPHSPYDPPQRLLDLYAGRAIPAPAAGAWSEGVGKKVTRPEASPEAPYAQFAADYIERSRRHYYASVTFVDEQVGRIVKALRERGMYDDALIIYVSDHGDMMGDHHMWRKTYAYEGSAAIPMLLKLPAAMPAVAKRGTAIDRPVELRDVLPTFLEAAGDTIPADMDGASLLPLVCRKDAPWRRWIDLEHATCYSADNNWCALTDGHMKYVWCWTTGTEQLFDLDRDPQETTDVAAERRYRKTLAAMRQALADHMAERGAAWSENGQLKVRKHKTLYSPNYPK